MYGKKPGLVSPGMTLRHDKCEAGAIFTPVGKRCNPPEWRGEWRRYSSQSLRDRHSTKCSALTTQQARIGNATSFHQKYPRVYIYIAEKHASPKITLCNGQRKRSRYSQHRLAGVGCVCAGDEMQGRDEVCKRGDARCDEGIPFCPTYRYYTSSE